MYYVNAYNLSVEQYLYFVSLGYTCSNITKYTDPLS